MPIKIKKPSENRYIKACVFAPAGAGKTVLLGTTALDERTSPAVMLDFEGGSESLAGLEIDIIEIHSWEDYNEAYELLVANKPVPEKDFKGGYKSVIIDSISETHKFALLAILDKEKDKRQNEDLIEQRDYGTATVQLRRLLRHFRDLPMHVFFSAHAKEIEIPREGRVRVPDLAGQMAEEVSGLVSVQGYLAQFQDDDGSNQRTLLMHSFQRFRIKARTPWGVVAPEEIVQPDVTKLLDVLGYGTNGAVLEQESSRGKHVDDGTPLKDENDLPGKEVPEEEEKKEEEDTPEEEAQPEEEVPASEEEKEEETPEEETQEAVVSDGDPSGSTVVPQLAEMNVAKLRTFGKEKDVDMAGCNTKAKALTRLAENGYTPE